MSSPAFADLIKALDNFSLFKYQGRDMDTLALYTKNIMSEKLYDDILAGKNIPNQITDLDVVRQAVAIFKQNMIGEVKETNDFRRIADLLGA